MELSVFTKTTLLLIASNVFMTLAWYGHLRSLNHQAWYVAAIVSNDPEKVARVVIRRIKEYEAGRT